MIEEVEKKIIFVKTSGNHSQMHNRFIEIANKRRNCFFSSIDFQNLLDSYVVEALVKLGIGRLFSDNILYRAVRRYRGYFRFFLSHTLLAKTKKFISDSGCNAIVLSDNYCSFIHILIITICTQLDIKVVLVPFVNQDLDDIYIAMSNNKTVNKNSRGFLAEYIKLKHPHWVLEFKGKQFLWAGALDILAINRIYNSRLNPKAGISNLVNNVLISGEVARQRFYSYGAKENNLHIIGDIIYDNVFLSLRTKDLNTVGVLFSIIPRLSHNCIYGSYTEYLQSYSVLIRNLINSGVKVYVSLHPSVNNSDRGLMESLGVKVDNRDISTLLGLSDLYISSYTSTITLASSIGIFCVDHDIYGINYLGNRSLDNVVCIKDANELDAVVESTVSKLQSRPNKTACADCEFLDGNVFERFLSYI